MDLLSSDSEEEKKLQKKAKKKTSSDVDSNALRVNQKFASEFERRERYKELQRAKEISLDDDVEPDSESDESEDEEAELLSPGLDVKILQTINMLKKKDPKIYDPNAKWFSDPSEDEDDSDDDSDDDGAKAEKKLRYKDVLRQQLIADGAGDSDADTSAKNKRDMESTKKSQLLYDREQEELRKQFLKAAKNVDGSDADDDANDSDDDLLQVKHKSAAERAEEERAYQQALEEMKALEKEKEAEESTFLHEFLSKKMWKDPTATRSNAMDTDDDNNDVSDEEDEEAFDEAERFESKYNFRFEELQAEQADELSPALRNDLAGALLLQQSRNQVVGHARNIEDSVRRVDEKRKKQRESRKEKKEKEKRQKEAELKRLKNLKKQELHERLTKITEIGGLKELGIDERFLEEDWDPEKHEQLMAQQFGDEYYGQDDDDIAALHRVDEDERYNVYEDDEGNVVDDDDVDGGAAAYGEDDGDEEAYAADPETAKAAVSQLMDEYYALDYEDLIAGMPCRFKYRSVDPEDFGLTTEDILLADDQELNHYVSLKKLAPYDTRGTLKGSKDLSKKRKRLRAALKERLAAEEEAATSKQERKAAKKLAAEQAAAAEAAGGEDDGEKKKRKRRKRKHRDGDNDGEGEGDGNAGAADDAAAAVDNDDEAPPAKVGKKATVKNSQPQQTQAHDDDNDDGDEDDAADDAAAAPSAKPQKEKRKRHHKKKTKSHHDGGKRSASLNPAAEAKQQRLALYR